MKVFVHHIYEYKKGLRNLILHTMPVGKQEEAIRKLTSNNISYHIQYVTPFKINIFFGEPQCVEIIRHFGDKPLNELSDEEDFILGTLLGYGQVQQCQRYLNRKEEKNAAYQVQMVG
ncbi:DUF2023 family protein [Marinilabiliaceae bacterium JC017]|nr:DUF2023 family protein [Marinilabiliaceae bacterium JC017]